MRKSTIAVTLAGALTVVGLATAGVAEGFRRGTVLPDGVSVPPRRPGPQVPYGTDPSVPYGVGNWNSPVPFGHGSSSYSGGAY